MNCLEMCVNKCNVWNVVIKGTEFKVRSREKNLNE